MEMTLRFGFKFKAYHCGIKIREGNLFVTGDYILILPTTKKQTIAK